MKTQKEIRSSLEWRFEKVIRHKDGSWSGFKLPRKWMSKRIVIAASDLAAENVCNGF